MSIIYTLKKVLAFIQLLSVYTWLECTSKSQNIKKEFGQISYVKPVFNRSIITGLIYDCP